MNSSTTLSPTLSDTEQQLADVAYLLGGRGPFGPAGHAAIQAALGRERETLERYRQHLRGELADVEARLGELSEILAADGT